MHTSAWNSPNSKLAVACPITALCWAAMVLQTPEIEKSTHFCGCDFRQNELFIKRWILAQCKPINSKLSEHNINPIIHQVATILPWVTGSSTLVSIQLPNSTAKFYCQILQLSEKWQLHFTGRDILLDLNGMQTKSAFILQSFPSATLPPALSSPASPKYPSSGTTT